MKKPTGAYIGREEDFQIAAIGYIRHTLRAAGYDRETAMHIPNGGARSAATGARLKAAGTVRGYPDIMVFVPEVLPPINRRKEVVIRRCGLAIELKVWPNSPSEEQEHVHEILRAADWRVVTCWSLDEVISAIKTHLDLE